MINNFKNNVLLTIEKIKTNEYHGGMDNLYYSSFFFLITSLYALYNKLYVCAILTFYLFITSVVFWNDYNNKFKLCSDHYMVFIMVCYTIFISFKIKNYVCLVSLGVLLLLYIISYHYLFKNNYLVSSNLWILAHCLVATTCIYMFNILKIYNKNN